MALKQKLIAFDDLDGYGPLLDKLAWKEAPPGERPLRSRIIRRAIRAELIFRRMIRPTKHDLAMGYQQGPPGNIVDSVETATTADISGKES